MRDSMYDLLQVENANIDPLQLIMPLLIPLAAVGLLVLVGFLFYAIRSWRVQVAILKTQKDVAEIREHLLKNSGANQTTSPKTDEIIP